MGYEIGDFVWAKMKGYPPWPSKIAEPNSSVKEPKTKKTHQFVYFFGSKDFAWILDENIIPHSEGSFDQLSKKRSKAYQRAIDEFKSCFETAEKPKDPSPKEVSESVKKTKVVKVIPSSPKKRKRSVLVSKSSVKRVSKKQKLDNNVNGGTRSGKLNVSVSSRHSVERDESLDNTTVSSEHSVERDESSVQSGSRTSDVMDDVTLDHLDQSPPPEKFGFIGLSNLGKAIVTQFMENGIEVTLWDENVVECREFIEMENGAKLASSPAELIINCDVTFCCCESDTDAFKNAVFGEEGILKGFEEAERSKNKRHKGYVGLTSVDYDTSKKINDAVIIKNGFYLEAPIVGSSEECLDCKLIILASGNRRLFTDCGGCFQVIASNAVFVSCEIGFSSKMSVILNTISGTVLAAMAEAMVLSRRLDLYEKDLLQILHLMLKSDSIRNKVERMGNHNYITVTPLKHVSRDINYSLTLANSVNQRMPITSAANEVYKHARLLNYSDSDVTAIYKIIRY